MAPVPKNLSMPVFVFNTVNVDFLSWVKIEESPNIDLIMRLLP